MSIEDKATIMSSNNAIIAENQQKVYDAGVTDGRQAEHDEFWTEALRYKGSSNKYQFAGRCWTDKTFNPPSKKLYVYNAQGMFRECRTTDLSAIFERTGFGLNTSTCEVFDEMYMQCASACIPLLDCSSGVYFTQVFSSTLIKIIDGIIFPNVARNFKTTFSDATALEEISYIGGTIQGNITFSSCTKLNHDTIMRVINALYDYVAEGSTTTYTLTLGTTNLAKLTDEEKAIATQKGWTLA